MIYPRPKMGVSNPFELSVKKSAQDLLQDKLQEYGLIPKDKPAEPGTSTETTTTPPSGFPAIDKRYLILGGLALAAVIAVIMIGRKKAIES